MSSWRHAAEAARQRQEARDRGGQEAKAADKLDAAGMRDAYQDVDIVAMEREGRAFDGTTEPRFMKSPVIAGHFDARTGRNLAYGEEPEVTEEEIRASALGETGMELFRTVGTAGYTMVRGVQGVLHDLGTVAAEKVPGLAPPAVLGRERAPSAAELGIAPETTMGDLVSAVSPFLLMGASSYTAMRGLLQGGRGLVSRIAMTGGASGAAADFVITDPMEPLILEQISSHYGLRTAVHEQLEGSPIRRRLGAAVEGAVMGEAISAGFRGGGALARELWHNADRFEQLAVEALTKRQTVLNEVGGAAVEAGKDLGWLTTWLAAKAMKGLRTINEDIAQQAEGWGFTGEEITAQWNRAAELMQEAAKRNFLKFAAKDDRLKLLQPFLTPEEQLLMTRQRAQTLYDQVQRLPPAEEFAAAAQAGVAKKGWYRESARALVDVFGHGDARRFTGLLAALSPQTSVESNLVNALQVWKNWTAAGRPTDAATIKAIMGESVQGTKGEESVLNVWIANSIESLSAADPYDVVLSGPKVDSFMVNLTNNLERVTNDAWIANFTGMPADWFSGSGKRAVPLRPDTLDPMTPAAAKKSNVAPIEAADPGYSDRYIALNVRMRQAAQQLTERTGEAWSPAEIQETIWSWAKTLYEASRGSGESVLKQSEQPAASEAIVETPDFATLLSDPKYAGILKEAGYGEQVEGLARRGGGFGSREATAPGRPGGPEPGPLRTAAARLDELRKARERIAAGRSQWAQRTPARPVRPAHGGVYEGGGYRAVAGGSGVAESVGRGGSGVQLAPSPGFEAAMTRVGQSTPNLYAMDASTESADAFRSAMVDAVESLGPMAKMSVDIKPNYAGERTFMTSDGKAGFAIDPKSGEIHSVFKAKGGPPSSVPAMLQAAVEQGGKWLNAFDTVLPRFYSYAGFKPVARLKFDSEFFASDKGEEALAAFREINAPFNGGEPDLVFMVYDPADTTKLAYNRAGGKEVKSYDEAVRLAKGSARGKKKTAKKKAARR